MPQMMVALAPMVAFPYRVVRYSSFSGNRCTGIQHISEHHARAQEYIILTNTGIKRHIVLHLPPLPRITSGMTTHILPKEQFANGAARHQMTKMPNAGAGSYGATRIYHCRGMYLL